MISSRTALTIGLVASILIGGCAKDKTTAPSEDDYELVATTAIGNSGGSLETADFSLLVPAGAWNTEATLKLLASTKDHPFGGHSVTTTFRCEGLPATSSRPLQLRVRHKGTLTGSTFLVLGRPVNTLDGDGYLTSFGYYPAVDSSGFLVCEIPASDTNVGLSKLPGGIPPDLLRETGTILGIDSYSRICGSSRLFCFYFPDELAGAVLHLSDCFDSNYNFFVNELGFPKDSLFHRYQTSYDPQYIGFGTLRDQSQSVRYTYHGSEKYRTVDDDHEDFVFNRSHVTAENSEKLATATAHEFAHFVEDRHECFYVCSSNLGWLVEAVAVWATGRFAPQGVPPDFSSFTSKLEPLKGLGIRPAPSDFWENVREEQKRGVGGTPVIKYLVDRYGNGFIRELLQAAKSSFPTASAVLVSTPEDYASVWFPDFVRKYVSGEIYGVPSREFVNGSQAECRLEGPSDTLWNLPADYLDLSARIHLVHLHNTALDSSAQITFKVSGSQAAGVMVFSVRNDTLGYLDYASEPTITRVRDLSRAGYDLMAVVINNEYRETAGGHITSLGLRVHVTEDRSLSGEYECYLGSDFIGHMLRDDSSTYSIMLNSTLINSAPGHWQGNTFTARWDTVYHLGYTKGAITATIDAIDGRITSYDGVDTIYRSDLGSTNILHIQISSLPFNFQELRGDAQGSAACEAVTLFECKWYGSTWWLEVQSIECDVSCGVAVVFSPWKSARKHLTTDRGEALSP